MLIISKICGAASLTVPLNSISTVDLTQTTGVWNTELQELHPTLQVENWDVGGGPGAPININVGDGSDGPFIISTYANFGTVSGNTVTLNTDIKSTFNFTNFDLLNNYAIVPTGSQPLIIRSLSDVRLRDFAGIKCSGGDGESTKQNDSGGTSPALGGSGRCGGGNGGNGNQAISGSGASGGAGVTGGTGAPSSVIVN
ncbi:MAG: hypothetical protein SGJ18_07165, partial [Pseudomonadota bacterium]|nr:hypothetical protein [Pseudomonadota bacterium]